MAGPARTEEEFREHIERQLPLVWRNAEGVKNAILHAIAAMASEGEQSLQTQHERTFMQLADGTYLDELIRDLRGQYRRVSEDDETFRTRTRPVQDAVTKPALEQIVLGLIVPRQPTLVLPFDEASASGNWRMQQDKPDIDDQSIEFVDQDGREAIHIQTSNSVNGFWEAQEEPGIWPTPQDWSFGQSSSYANPNVFIETWTGIAGNNDELGVTVYTDATHYTRFAITMTGGSTWKSYELTGALGTDGPDGPVDWSQVCYVELDSVPSGPATNIYVSDIRILPRGVGGTASPVPLIWEYWEAGHPMGGSGTEIGFTVQLGPQQTDQDTSSFLLNTGDNAATWIVNGGVTPFLMATGAHIGDPSAPYAGAFLGEGGLDSSKILSDIEAAVRAARAGGVPFDITVGP